MFRNRVWASLTERFSGAFVTTSRELLKSSATPGNLATADFSELTAFLSRIRGRLGTADWH
jgi:hypothetical protein